MTDDQGRAGEVPTCSATFHHTTARGFCSKCGKAWKHDRRKIVQEAEHGLGGRPPALSDPRVPNDCGPRPEQPIGPDQEVR